jgi:hypothetical protein
MNAIETCYTSEIDDQIDCVDYENDPEIDCIYVKEDKINFEIDRFDVECSEHTNTFKMCPKHSLELVYSIGL